MKVKVLKYKFDGNTVVAPYMELEAYAENVYTSLSAKNEYGNEDDDCFHVVCKIENVYFSCGQYSRRILDKEGHREEAAGYCRNWITNTLRDAENGSHITLLSIRVFERLGLDTAPLLQAREAYRKSRNKGGGNRRRKRTRGAGWRKQNGNRPLMKENKSSWTEMRLQRIFSSRLLNGTVLKSISGPKARWAGM